MTQESFSIRLWLTGAKMNLRWVYYYKYLILFFFQKNKGLRVARKNI
jgi:hypothetical protein